jgi:prevent-host-death family protein
MDEFMSAGQFKAHCYKVIARVKRTRKRIIITNKDVPVAQIVPINEEKTPLFGKMKGTIHFLGDVIDPIEVEWKS